ncbi:hypothetical protein [Chryseobacterium sp. KMC2]|uniref:hypothetical protein n=1 Tax=Chryseobacterium sp. KMC2 TaxID=2800705 RepID=UPI001920765A|nr:hypothetical protein [Chryseobacterium sp. KMC2]MBL3549151.1 hypothetical protein [Chryseobacterium sp. KMC2]
MEISYGEIIGWAGGLSVIISGVGTWISQLILSKRTEKWRSSTEIKLKVLESQLSEKTSMLNNLIDIQKSNYNFSQERRIVAIETVWKLYNEFMFNLPESIRTVNNIRPEAYSEYLNKTEFKPDEDIKKDMLDIEENETFAVLFSDMRETLTYNRPFLGEDLFYLINTNFMFVIKIIWNIIKGIEDNKLEHWQTDGYLLKLIAKVIPKEEYDFIIKYKRRSYNYTLDLFQKLIIESMNSLLSGKLASEHTIKHYKDIRVLLSEFDKN